MGSGFQKLVSIGLVFTLIFPPSVVAAANNDDPPDEAAIDQLSAEIFPKLTTETVAQGERAEGFVAVLFEAAHQLEQEAEKIVAARGEEYLADLIAKNQFVVHDEQTGMKMEYRLIDGHRVPRFIMAEKAYILIDEKIIPRDSKHLQTYIARTHMESGANRLKIGPNGEIEKTIFGNDKRTSGRDLTIVFLNDDVTRVENLPKPKPTQWKWWKEYFISKYKSPTVDDFTMACWTGAVMQGALAFGLTMFKHKFRGEEFTMIPTYWTMAYSLGIGTFVSFYKNWTVTSGSRLTRILKAQTTSSLYAVGLVMAITDGSAGDRVSAVSLLTAEGQAKNTSLLANGLMNNYAKDYWYQIQRIRDATRENAGSVSFKIPFVDRQINWSRSKLESQYLYLIPWTINFISLIILDSFDIFQIPGTKIKLPILQWAAIPAAMWWSKMYARRLANRAKNDPESRLNAAEMEEMAKNYEAAWEKAFSASLSERADRWSGYLKNTGGSLKQLAQKCIDLFR